MQKHLVTVIVPIYNAADTIHRCIDSITHQTYENLEIILVNDGSIDSSGEICDSFADQDNRIKVIHKKNGGQAEARNKGLDLAHGKYVAFVDADDFINRRMYETLVGICEREHAQIACCGMRKVTTNDCHNEINDEELDRNFIVYNFENAMREHLNNIRITSSPCDKLFDRSVWRGVRMIEGMIYEDLEVIPRCLANAEKVVYIPAKLYYYVQTPSSTIRGEFSLRQFDMMKAGLMRVATYQEYCPVHVEQAEEKYMELCMDLIFLSRRNTEADDKRKEAAKETLRIVMKLGWSHLRIQNRIKAITLKIGVNFFVFCMQIYYSIIGFYKRNYE